MRNSDNSPAARRVVLALVEGAEVLDFAGPLQAFHEANGLLPQPGYELLLCAAAGQLSTAQGLCLTALKPLPEVTGQDLVLVPGYRLDKDTPPRELIGWLRRAAQTGARICSICTGAFALGEAGLLDGRACTTHWKRTAQLQRCFPRARVQEDRLFVEDGRIATSAGIAAGIDMSLALIEQDHGPQMAAAVAREMVVYLRREAGHSQGSVYLDFRNHVHAGVHRIQDFLLSHPEQRTTLDQLARLAGLSQRQLTRVFRRQTGISISAFRTRIRLEHAQTLINNPALSIEDVAQQCGFLDDRQLRRLWKQTYGVSPRQSRA
jgi:transcriptional regulator GlxA family with amidase domain